MDTIPQLPPSITAVAIREATLPVKIEAARRAIANCTDLPELMRYRDAAQGIAAAVKVMKNVAPEMISQANRMSKEAIIRMGALLLKYNGEAPISARGTKDNGGPSYTGRDFSERTKIYKSLGIPRSLATESTRLALAPKKVLNRIINDDSISAAPRQMITEVPTRRAARPGAGFSHSDPMRMIMNGTYAAGGTGGLNKVTWNLKKVDLNEFKLLTPEERKTVKAKIVECQELLDAMEQRL